MPLLNPYLRAFFRSTLPAQCTPVQDYILLVPTTEILTSTRDRESGALYADLAGVDEFLGSHVLRVPSGGSSSPMVGSRENRGKARQFTTFNGRTVVVKDSWVYSNKGFRSLNQAQLLNDTLFYPDISDPQQWLIYFISRPLIGSLEVVSTIPPQLRDRTAVETTASRATGQASSSGPSAKKKDVKSFNELLMLFPMIARQMQPGLEKLFQDFEVSFQKFKPLPMPPPSPKSVASGVSSSRASTHSSVSGDVYKQAADEAEIRRSLENAIMTAVDLFQRVDQSQLNLLASTTDLTGPACDRLIERYVAEQLHDSILFPRLCATKSIEDEELEGKIMDMANVDLTQVGIPSLDQQEKKSLVNRLGRGIKSFAQIGAAKSPHAMTEYLLETAQTLTRDRLDDDPPESEPKNPEKSSVVTMNADMLVSLLLIVVIRAKVPNLHACLSYMRNFIFAEDVEQGETGYILSTLEAVLFHIAQDHALSAASRSNEKLWRSVKAGDLEAVRRLLEVGGDSRSRASSRVRSDDGFESKSEKGSDEENTLGQNGENGNSEGHNIEGQNGVPTVQIYSPVAEHGEGFMEELQKVSETNGDNDEESGSEDVEDGNVTKTTEETAEETTKDEITSHESATNSAKSKQEPKSTIGDTVEEAESSQDALKNGEQEIEEEKELPAGPTVTKPLTKSETVEEVFIDPFEAEPVDAPSVPAGSISTLRIEDIIVDGQDDSASVLSITLAPPVPTKPPRGSPNGRAGTARFEVDEPVSSNKFPSRRERWSTASLATTLNDTSSMTRLSRTYTSQSQTADSFSVEKLSKTRNANGESVLMMAVQEGRTEVLKYLLETKLFDLEFLVEDTNNEGTTLLSAAVQAESQDIVDLICPYLFELDEAALRKYFARPDTAGRTVAHYLFNTPDLIKRLGRWLPWKVKDRNGQTPLFALCRSYDHAKYKEMVSSAIKQAQAAQGDGCKLHLDEHVDNKGNTLLHIAGDPSVLRTMLRCDSEVNAVNDRGFTALMVASKYGRVEMVRTFFADGRVDLLAKELRGLTAVELAKDDDVRNRIDDLVLFQNPYGDDGRVTAVVRSFFVEDATIRVVVKSGAPAGESTFTITTCRRSLTDFQFLQEWLQYENPGSWLPVLNVSRSPYQIPSKPSRSVLRDIQLRVDCFLKTLLTHSTFSTHELLWEFFLVPDLQQELMIERSKKKAEIRMERIREEFTPVEDIRDVENFVSYAKDSVRSVNYACRSVTRRATALRYSMLDLSDSYKFCLKHLSGFKFLQDTEHLSAFNRFLETLVPNESNPYTLFIEDFRNLQASLNGVMAAMDRPRQLINQMSVLQKQVDKHILSLRRSDRWPLGLLDDTRAKIHQEAAENVAKSKEEYMQLSSELRCTQTVAAAELSSFHDLHEKIAKRAIRDFTKRCVVGERAKLESMKRAIRGISKMGFEKPPKPMTAPTEN
ncbi:hypothetical protein DFP73DRAFT_560496 [Morchella snyderi]|nr:hypothetical protein DFP73DRAFT_560496 [Morchella snyderi]